MDVLQIRELKQSLERRDARILELERQLESARQPERGEAVGVLSIDYQGFHSFKLKNANLPTGDYNCYAHPPATDARASLSVWYGAMPESNGKTNWTAILVRDGDIASGYTFAWSEYEDRVRYEADSMRFIIGEVAERPDLMAYDPDKHSGYVYPPTAADARVAELEARLAVKRSACEVQGLLVKAGHQRIAALEAQLAESREREGRWVEYAKRQRASGAPIPQPLFAETKAALAAEKGEK